MSEPEGQPHAQNPEEWLKKQPDLIQCKLGCLMKEKSCHERQLKHYRYMQYYDGWKTITAISPMFASCKKCVHFLPDNDVPRLAPPNLDDIMIIFGEAA